MTKAPDERLREIQRQVTRMGHDPGPLDGLWGPRTEAALRGLIAAGGQAPSAGLTGDLPWMVEAKRALGRHEVRDNFWLMSWLKSDGRTLGDPAKQPWCGDFVETCIRLGLPGENLPGALGANPYWARNWLLLGHACTPSYGAVLVFSRPGGGGHVGFAVGQDPGHFHVLGGNQSNAVTVARIDRARLLGSRWPATHPTRPVTLPLMAPGQTVITTNEA
jgi:uncharacterized protein (TIGR02594 family)